MPSRSARACDNWCRRHSVRPCCPVGICAGMPVGLARRAISHEPETPAPQGPCSPASDVTRARPPASGCASAGPSLGLAASLSGRPGPLEQLGGRLVLRVCQAPRATGGQFAARPMALAASGSGGDHIPAGLKFRVKLGGVGLRLEGDPHRRLDDRSKSAVKMRRSGA
jgi:hypothetical protein